MNLCNSSIKTSFDPSLDNEAFDLIKKIRKGVTIADPIMTDTKPGRKARNES